MKNLHLVSSALAAVVLIACGPESTEPSANSASVPPMAVPPGPATTISATGQVHFHPRSGEVTTTQAVEGTVTVGKRFSSVELVCLDFEFSGDLVDEGDEMNISVDGNDAGGFSLPTGWAPQATRTFCWIPGHDTIIAAVLDGRAKVRLTAYTGSMRVNALSMTITGIPR